MLCYGLVQLIQRTVFRQFKANKTVKALSCLCNLPIYFMQAFECEFENETF